MNIWALLLLIVGAIALIATSVVVFFDSIDEED